MLEDEAAGAQQPSSDSDEAFSSGRLLWEKDRCKEGLVVLSGDEATWCGKRDGWAAFSRTFPLLPLGVSDDDVTTAAGNKEYGPAAASVGSRLVADAAALKGAPMLAMVLVGLPPIPEKLLVVLLVV